MSLRALVVDDEQLARDELCFLLESVPDIEVVGQASNGLEAVEMVGGTVDRRAAYGFTPGDAAHFAYG